MTTLGQYIRDQFQLQADAFPRPVYADDIVADAIEVFDGELGKKAATFHAMADLDHRFRQVIQALADQDVPYRAWLVGQYRRALELNGPVTAEFIKDEFDLSEEEFAYQSWRDFPVEINFIRRDADLPKRVSV